MSAEKPLGPSSISSEEKQPREILKTDPTRYSPLPPAEPLTPVDGALGAHGVVESEGTRYFEISKTPEKQRAIAQMAKGIINVSDVIKVHNNTGATDFYSKEMPLEKVGPMQSGEIAADIFLLRYIFGDYDDRSLSGGLGHNVREKNGRAIYFDFDRTEPFSIEQPPSWLSDTHRAYIRESLNRDRETLEVLKKKLEQLEERFEGESGAQFLSAIVTDSGLSPDMLFLGKKELSAAGYTTTDQVKMFQTMLLEEIECVHEVAEERIKEFDSSSE